MFLLAGISDSLSLSTDSWPVLWLSNPEIPSVPTWFTWQSFTGFGPIPSSHHVRCDLTPGPCGWEILDFCLEPGAEAAILWTTCVKINRVNMVRSRVDVTMGNGKWKHAEDQHPKLHRYKDGQWLAFNRHLLSLDSDCWCFFFITGVTSKSAKKAGEKRTFLFHRVKFCS